MHAVSTVRLSARSRDRPARPITRCDTLAALGQSRSLPARDVMLRLTSIRVQASASSCPNVSGSCSPTVGASSTSSSRSCRHGQRATARAAATRKARVAAGAAPGRACSFNPMTLSSKGIASCRVDSRSTSLSITVRLPMLLTAAPCTRSHRQALASSGVPASAREYGQRKLQTGCVFRATRQEDSQEGCAPRRPSARHKRVARSARIAVQYGFVSASLKCLSRGGLERSPAGAWS